MHERPDVVKYRQDVFLPVMTEYRKYLVEYTAGNDLVKMPPNLIQCRLVLLACENLANDGRWKAWIQYNDPLKKKGGQHRGCHIGRIATCVSARGTFDPVILFQSFFSDRSMRIDSTYYISRPNLLGCRLAWLSLLLEPSLSPGVSFTCYSVAL